MKLKLNKEHKSKSSREKADKEEEKLLKPQKKVLSFTRVKEKKAKALEVQQVTGPDLEDFRDLIDDDEPTPEEGKTRTSKAIGSTGSLLLNPSARVLSSSSPKTRQKHSPCINTLHPCQIL